MSKRSLHIALSESALTRLAELAQAAGKTRQQYIEDWLSLATPVFAKTAPVSARPKAHTDIPKAHVDIPAREPMSIPKSPVLAELEAKAGLQSASPVKKDPVAALERAQKATTARLETSDLSTFQGSFFKGKK